MAQQQDPIAGHTLGLLNDLDGNATGDPIAGLMLGYLIDPARIATADPVFVVRFDSEALITVRFDAY